MNCVIDTYEFLVVVLDDRAWGQTHRRHHTMEKLVEIR